MGKVHWRSLAEAVREIARLQKLLREAVELGREANGDPSSCSYSVPVGDRLTEIRKEIG